MRVIALLLLVASVTADGPGSTFTAATIQSNPVKGSTPEETRLLTAHHFEPFIAEAVFKGARIVVFPELSLGVDELSRAESVKYGEHIPTPDPNTPITPCGSAHWNSTSPAFHFLSCIAKEYNVYVVYGCIDLQPCGNKTNCPKDGLDVYNTAVVLDDQGQFIQKYWKENIMFTLTHVFQVPPAPQVRYFDTSFGVRFGLFICFDILWQHPTLDLIKMGVRHFTFPTSWVNFPPIMTALEVQQGWSTAQNSVLLAANEAKSPAVSGSGIYVAGVPKSQYFEWQKGAADEHMQLAKDLPVDIKDPEMEEPSVTHPRNTDVALIPFERPRRPLNACGMVHGDCHYFFPVSGMKTTLHAEIDGLQCSAQIAVTSAGKKERFALFAINEQLSLGQTWTLHLRTCGVAKCFDNHEICIVLDPTTLKPVENLYESTAVFSTLKVSGAGFNATEQQYVMPMVSVTGGHVLANTPKNFASNGTAAHLHVDTKTPVVDASLLQREWY